MTSETIVRSLTLANPWWSGQPIPNQYLPAYERPQLQIVMEYRSLGRIIVVKGPRRTGKTTLIYQYISRLLKEGVNPTQILFVSHDDLTLRLPLQELLDSYNILTRPDPGDKFVFLDEVQFLPNWSDMAKVITDRDKLLHLVVSGSSSSIISRGSESLAGRTVEELLLPFSPREIFQLQNPAINLSAPVGSDLVSCLTYDPSMAAQIVPIQKVTDKYLHRGGFPHLLETKPDSLWLELLRTDIVHKAIYRDLADLYQISDPATLERLFLYLVSVTSSILNSTSVAGQLKLGRATLNRYLQFLISAYLVFSLPKYSLYPKEVLKSQEKIHTIDPGLAQLVSPPGRNRLLESSIAGLLLRHKLQHLYYWRDNYEVDCIAQQNERLVPIEIKDSPVAPSPTQVRGLINFMEKFNVKDGYVIYQGEAQEKIRHGTKIHFIPAWYALIRL